MFEMLNIKSLEQAALLEQMSRWVFAYGADLVRYLVGVGLVSFTLFVVFRNFSEERRIQNKRATLVDKKRELIRSLITVGVYASVTLFTIAAIENGWTQLYEVIQTGGWLYVIACVPMLLVLHDAYFYWAHRAMHHPRLFPIMHRVHHLSRTPTVLAAYSFSVWEAMIMTLFVPIIITLIPVHPVALFIFLAIMIVRNAMGHSGVEFHPKGWVDSGFDVFTTVTHHDLHHQKFTGNYGLYFTWWDRWMGTELPGYKDAFRQAATAHGSESRLVPESVKEASL